METKFVTGLALAFIALAALIPMPATAGQLFPVMAFSFCPNYYSAEWPPWDLSSDYYSAEWAPWDSWAMPGYCGGYGMYRWSLWNYSEWAQAWPNRHHPHGAAKVARMIVKPPVTLAVIRPVREPKDPAEPNMKRTGRPERASSHRHGHPQDDRTGPASMSGSGVSGSRQKPGGASVHTWDEIIAGYKARGLDWPPASSADAENGGPSNGSKGRHKAPTKPTAAAPAVSSGSGKQR